MASEPVTCPACGSNLPKEALAGLCPKCVFEDSFKRLQESYELSDDHTDKATHFFHHYPPGTKFGDYELLEEIARGGMGIVFRARQLSLNRIVAFKLLLWGPHSSREFVQRFNTEALAAASLQHPNLVCIHEVGFGDGQHFMAMECVAGPSLAEVVRKGPISARCAASYMKTIAEAIHYAHERGILHRDLKPSNVLIDPFDRPKVTDFGLAKRLLSDSSFAGDCTSITLTGQVLGSPNYMPPEQAAGKRGQIDRRSDVYSLGAILYHLLTGQPPFAAESVPETLHQVYFAEPVAPRALNASVPTDLENICLKCLEKNSSCRYSTAKRLADDLDQFLRDEPVRTRPERQTEKAWPIQAEPNGYLHPTVKKLIPMTYWLAAVSIYMIVLATSFGLAYLLRFEFSVPELEAKRAWYFMLSFVTVKLFLFHIRNEFKGHISRFSLPELQEITTSLSLAVLFQFGLWYLSGGLLAPARSIILTDFFISILLVCSLRLFLRSAISVELRDQLRDLLRPPPSLFRLPLQAWRWSVRHPVIATLVVIVLLAYSLAIAILTWQNQ